MERLNEAINGLEEKRKQYDQQKHDRIKTQHLIKSTKEEVIMSLIDHKNRLTEFSRIWIVIQMKTNRSS